MAPTAPLEPGQESSDPTMGDTVSGDDPRGDVTAVELEALLFVAERPLTRREIAALADVGPEVVDARLGDLEVELHGRGLRLLTSGERVELATDPEAGRLAARYVGAGPVRLSPAALETLAIVAYRQPVTRAVVERIRGVDSDHVLRGLLHRRLVVEQGRADVPGRPFLYGTSFDFLERFGLTSLDDLPPLDTDLAVRLVEAESADDARDAPDAPEAPDPEGDRAVRTADAQGDAPLEGDG